MNCFEADGALTWFHDQATGPAISDCYALNVTGSECWFYAYTDFDLTRVYGKGKVTRWPTLVRGAHAIAVHGKCVVFGPGYKDRDAARPNMSTHVQVFRRGKHGLKETGAVRLAGLPESTEVWRGPVGRGPFLWMTDDIRALGYHVADIV